MSNRASAWAWDVDLKGDPMVKFVLVALADQADDYGYCWPSQKKIAKKVCQGERTVRRHIATLRDLGLLTVIHRSSTRGRRSNGYQLHVGMKLEESLKSRLPANLAGSGEPTDDAPVDNSDGQGDSPAIPATGQSGRLRKRPDWPVAQEASGGRSLPANGGRLLPIREPSLEPPDQTRPEGEVTRAPGAGDGPVRSGQAGSSEPGRSSRARERGSACGGRRPSASSAGASSARSVEDQQLIDRCLPGHLRSLDASGRATVAGLLRDRLAAGWGAEQIRSLMDQPLPERVGRLSALVARRLELNVDVEAPPSPSGTIVADATSVRRSEDELAARRRRRSEELAAPQDRPVPSESWSAMVAEVTASMPGASPLEVARELARRAAQDGVS